ncbi:MAG: hypothetical protein R8P61_32290 [Bacteroidia bacterium]|nr:hypothetical protein [Bacteroidia bacterium]
MFDTIKCLVAGFTLQLSAYRKAEKVVWILLVVFLTGWLTTAFAAWVSQPAYLAMTNSLPYAFELSMFFTIGIASVLYFMLSYLAGFCVEIWLSVPKADRDYRPVGAKIFLGCALLFLSADLYMNWKGREYRADENAGAKQVFSYTMSESDQADIKKHHHALSKLLGGNLGGYGWKDKQGLYHLNQSGKKYQRELSSSIRRIQQSDSTKQAQFISSMNANNKLINDTKQRIKDTLGNAVKGVYAFMLMLCIAQAFCVENIQREAAAVFAKSGARLSVKLPIKSKHVKRKMAVADRAISPTVKSDKNTRHFGQSKHPEFSSKIQPPLPRGIDKKKYKKLVKYYHRIPAKADGSPNKSALSNKTGIARTTIGKYIHIALERADIKEA